jgi:hypothetical protein
VLTAAAKVRLSHICSGRTGATGRKRRISMFRIRSRAAVVVAVTVTSALLLTACGGASKGSDDSGQKPSSSAQKEQKTDGGINYLNMPLPLARTSAMDLVHASVPEWNFTGALGNDPCWPEDAFDPDGTPNDGGDVADWPHSDDTCAVKGSPHPTYFSVRQCGPDQARVSFTIYMATSGFEPSGHPHDFEHIDVVWKLNEGWTEWTRDYLLMSQHSRHGLRAWADAESWNADRGSAGLGREFPRIFVGFGSHAMFNNQNGHQDVGSAYTGLEYRAADYQSWADTNLVRVAPDDPNGLYQKFKDNADAWGSADSNPARTYDTLCTHNEDGRGDGT